MPAKEKIRVVVVDDIAETRENIRKLLQFESDVEVAGVARTGREGIDLSKDVKPDVVIMDINMPDMDGITATEAIRRVIPYAQIIILSVQSDSNYMRRAMQAGAHDFLTKPPTVDELTSAIRRAGTLAHEERVKAMASYPSQVIGPGGVAMSIPSVSQGQIITIYSPKGGTGRTTIATNLAISLFSENTSVILVDGNLQFGDVAVFLNEQGKFSVNDLASRADELDSEVVDNVIVKHALSGIKILPAPFRPEHAESVTGDQFGKVLKFLRHMFSYVIVDTSSALTDITLSAIDASDIILLVTTQDIPAIKNSRLFLDLADVLGIDRRRILFIMNRYDKRIGITAEKVSDNFKHEIVATIPFEERVVVPSVNRGQPFIINNKTTPIARSILALNEILKQRISELQSQGQPVNVSKSPGR